MPPPRPPPHVFAPPRRRLPAPNFHRIDPRRPYLRAAPRSSPSGSNSHPPPSHIAGKTSPAAATPPHTKNISCRHPTQFPQAPPRVFTTPNSVTKSTHHEAAHITCSGQL